MRDAEVCAKADGKPPKTALKFYLSWLLICAFYMIGCDLLSYHVGQQHLEFNFYPLSTILLYVALFYIGACISLSAFLLIYFAVYAFRDYRARPFWSRLAKDFRNDFLTLNQLIDVSIVFVLIPLFFAYVGMFKQLIPFVKPFSWDQTFMHWDYLLHFHHQPWELLQPYLGHPAITVFLSKIYGLWFTMVAGMIVWQAFTKERLYRMQFFLTFFVSWILLGTFMAYFLSSAGPCFYSVFSGDTHDPYAPLMLYLYENAPPWVTELQRYLSAELMSGTLIFGGGVSAMPSMHISMAALFFLVSAARYTWLGWVSFIFMVLTVISSIHLAWHYAVDCYVAIIATAIIWYTMGKIVRYSVNKDNSRSAMTVIG